jgi:hypothetical protein
MLGYFPAVSVFRGGAAEVNFGPDFWYPPPSLVENDDVDMVGGAGASDQGAKGKEIQAVEKRYNEQIAEDVVYDLLDEVDFGCKMVVDLRKQCQVLVMLLRPCLGLLIRKLLRLRQQRVRLVAITAPARLKIVQEDE